jgi:hypothetical protein
MGSLWFKAEQLQAVSEESNAGKSENEPAAEVLLPPGPALSGLRVVDIDSYAEAALVRIDGKKLPVAHGIKLVSSFARSLTSGIAEHNKLPVGTAVMITHAPSRGRLRASENSRGGALVGLAAAGTSMDAEIDSDRACHWLVEPNGVAVALKNVQYGTYLHVPPDKTPGSAIMLSDTRGDMGSQWTVGTAGSAITLTSLRSGLHLHADCSRRGLPGASAAAARIFGGGGGMFGGTGGVLGAGATAGPIFGGGGGMFGGTGGVLGAGATAGPIFGGGGGMFGGTGGVLGAGATAGPIFGGGGGMFGTV